MIGRSVKKVTVALGACWLLGTGVSVANAQEKPAPQAWEQAIPGTLVKFSMQPVPGGTLDIVVDGKAQKTPLKPFSIGTTEVRWDEFDVYAFRLDLSQEEQAAGVDAKSRPSKPYGAPDRGFGHEGFAALAMTFTSAQGYCEWLSKKTGKKFRLPTEAEWEWAARAGDTTLVPLTTDQLNQAAWWWDNAEDKAQQTASKKANAWGLHDVLGNVWEWCIAGPDAKNAVGVVRGGSYLSKAPDVQYSARAQQTAKWNETDPQNPKSRWWLANAPWVGFRVVCED